MTDNEIETTLRQLKALKFRALNKPESLCYGICAHLSYEEFFLEIAWLRFKSPSGIDYPINDPDSLLSPQKQYLTFPLWEGKQLQLRLELIDYAIQQLEGNIHANNA